MDIWIHYRNYKMQKCKQTKLPSLRFNYCVFFTEHMQFWNYIRNDIPRNFFDLRTGNPITSAIIMHILCHCYWQVFGKILTLIIYSSNWHIKKLDIAKRVYFQQIYDSYMFLQILQCNFENEPK